MKRIFDKAPLQTYLQSVKRDGVFDLVGLVLLFLISALFIFNIVDMSFYKYTLSILVSIKVFLILNTKSKIQEYVSKFNQFYNGDNNA
jgi:hypothetical protein